METHFSADLPAPFSSTSRSGDFWQQSVDIFHRENDDLDDDIFENLLGRRRDAYPRRRWARQEEHCAPERGHVRNAEQLYSRMQGGRQKAADTPPTNVTHKPDEALEGVYKKIR